MTAPPIALFSMTYRLAVLFVALLTAVSALAAERVEVAFDSRGIPLVMIDYPWAAHESSSIEFRTIVAGEAESVAIAPLFFVAQRLHGDVTVDVFRTEELAARHRTEKLWTESGGRQWLAVGERNLMGRPAVTLLTQTPSTASGSASQLASRAVFPLLAAWADGGGRLIFELPVSHFASASTLRIWFLRQGHILWSADVRWPGIKALPPPLVAAPGS